MRWTSKFGMRISIFFLLLATENRAFFFSPCNCNSRCEDYNPCPIPPACPEPSPCGPYSYNSYPTGPYNGYNGYPMQNMYQASLFSLLNPAPAYYAPAYNTYSTGYSSQPNNWYQSSYPNPYGQQPQYPAPAYPPPSYGSYPSATKPAAKLPQLTPLPTVNQPDEYGYTANKIYRPVPEAVPASTQAYEKPDEVIELEPTDTEYYPRMDKVTVEPYNPPVSEYTPTIDNEDHSTEVGDYEYKNVGGGTTPVPYSPPEPTNDSSAPQIEVGPTPSGYDSNTDPNTPTFNGGNANYNNANTNNVVPEYPDVNTTPAPYSTTDYTSPPDYSNPKQYGSGKQEAYGGAAPPTDAAYSDVVYPIPPPSRRNAHFESEFDKSGELDERHQMMRQLKIRRASTPPPIPRTSSTCNSEKLGDAMIGVIVSDVSISKRRVAKATAEAFTWERFDVFCAKGEFSYSIHARKYCEVTKGDVTCFAFR